MPNVAIIERGATGALRGTLYRITHNEPSSDRPTDASTALPIERLSDGWSRVKLPNKRLFVQIDGVPIEGYVPMRAKSGEVDIASYERVRYQTLRDGILIEDASAYDGIFEIIDPRLGLPSSYSLPAIIGENLVPDEPGGLGIRVVDYAYPHYYGNGASGENRRPGLAYSHLFGNYQGRYDKYHDTTGVITGSDRRELSASSCGLVRVKYRRGSGGVAGSRNYDTGSVTYEVIKALSAEEKIRVRNVINSLGALNYEINGSADPSWIINTATSQRGVARSLYVRGDVKGVYAKEIS